MAETDSEEILHDRATTLNGANFISNSSAAATQRLPISVVVVVVVLRVDLTQLLIRVAQTRVYAAWFSRLRRLITANCHASVSNFVRLHRILKKCQYTLRYELIPNYNRNIYSQLLTVVIWNYVVSQRFRFNRWVSSRTCQYILPLTLPNAGRFSKLFHRRT